MISWLVLLKIQINILNLCVGASLSLMGQHVFRAESNFNNHVCLYFFVCFVVIFDLKSFLLCFPILNWNGRERRIHEGWP